MAERVLELAVAIAPELVGNRHGDLRAGLDRARDETVDVVDVQVNGDRRALERLRPERAPLWHLIGQHYGRVSNAHGGMHELAIGPRHPRGLLRAESQLVEIDRLGRAGTDEMRCHGMHALWNLHVATSFSLRDSLGNGGKGSAIAPAPRLSAAEPAYINV